MVLAFSYVILVYAVLDQNDINVAIRSSEESTRDMLAYGRLIIREVQQHGGQDWLDYDRIFHQQAAIDHNLKWNFIHPSIQAATLVHNSGTSGSFCSCVMRRTTQRSLMRQIF